jgi:hypothetical protein
MNRTTIEQKLKALPNTPDEIAKFLLAGGFIGSRGSCYRCPTANYLGRGVAVKPDKIILDTDTDQYLAVPEPLSEFIGKFDQGDYPELIEDPLHISF